jgi:hypothetical protein
MLGVITMVTNVISIVLSLLALIISLFVAQRQLRASRDSDSISAMLQLFGEYRTDEFRSARRAIFRMNFSQPCQLLIEMRAQQREEIELVAHFFEHVGLLIAFDLIPAEPMVAFFGFSCQQLWLKLESTIEAERQARGIENYLAYFEMFANLAARNGAEKINAAAAKRMLKM